MKGLMKLLTEHLQKDGGWVESSTLEEMTWLHPKKGTRYKPSTVGRKLRLLADADHNVLEVDDTRGRSVWYRYKRKPVRIPIIEDGLFKGYQLV